MLKNQGALGHEFQSRHHLQALYTPFRRSVRLRSIPGRSLQLKASSRRVCDHIVEKAMPPRRKRGRETTASSPEKLVRQKHDVEDDALDSPIRLQPPISASKCQGKHVALLRGINVGTAKQVPMAKLALCFEQLGYRNVRTVLRSGNVVFDGEEALATDAAARVEAAVRKATGVQSSVLLVSGRRFLAIADANPLLEVATDGSKSFVSFVGPSISSSLALPDPSDLAPEVLRIGKGAIYQWIPGVFEIGGAEIFLETFRHRDDAQLEHRDPNPRSALMTYLQAMESKELGLLTSLQHYKQKSTSCRIHILLGGDEFLQH